MVGMKLYLVLIFIFFFSVLVGPSNAAVLVVNKTAPACTTGNSFFTTILAAVSAANDSDRIIVCPGTYKEVFIFINDFNLSITSFAGPNNTIIESNVSFILSPTIFFAANRTTFTGFTIRGKNFSDPVVSIFTNFNNFSNNVIFNNTNGISIRAGNNNIIERNNFTVRQTAISLNNSHDNNISRNNIFMDLFNFNNSKGILLNSSHRNTILLNTVINIRGLHLFNSENNTIRQNNLTSNDVYGLLLEFSKRNNITLNNFTSNLYGTALSSSGNNTFDGNLWSNNLVNFYIYGSSTFDYIQQINNQTNLIQTSEFPTPGRIVYLVNRNNMSITGTIPSPIAFFACISCDNVKADNIKGSRNSHGALLYNSKNSVIKNSLFFNILPPPATLDDPFLDGAKLRTGYGIYVGGSSLALNTRNILDSNTIAGFREGIRIQTGNNNTAVSNTVILLSDLSNTSTEIGLEVSGSEKNTVYFNNVSGADIGLDLSGSNNNTICFNQVFLNDMGIYIAGSSNNIICSNNLTNNFQYGFVFEPVPAFYNNITENFVNGELFYHLFRENNRILRDLNLSAPRVSNFGRINVINSTNVTIFNVSIRNNTGVVYYYVRPIAGGGGIFFYGSFGDSVLNSTISGSNFGIYSNLTSKLLIRGTAVENNSVGIRIDNSPSANTVTRTTIKKNNEGLKALSNTFGNNIYCNNFIDNSVPVIENTDNTYTVLSQGNHWSNFNDPSEGCSGTIDDGICDSPYTVSLFSTDTAPFMAPNACLPTNLDISVSKIEVIQVIGNASLIARKPTAVRVFLNVSGADNVSNIQGLLFGFDSSGALPGSPIVSTVVSARNVSISYNLDNTLNFYLPNSWNPTLSSVGDNKTINLSVLVNFGNITTINEITWTNNQKNRSVTFHQNVRMPTHFHHVNIPNFSFVSFSDLSTIQDQLKKVFPVTYGSVGENWQVADCVVNLDYNFNSTLHIIDFLVFDNNASTSIKKQVASDLLTQCWNFADPVDISDNEKFHAVINTSVRINVRPNYSDPCCGYSIDDCCSASYALNRTPITRRFRELRSATHEISHDFGRKHTPNLTTDPVCSSPTGIDNNYPYPSGVIAFVGFDVLNRTLYNDTTYDYMSYCYPSTQFWWVSDYTYNNMWPNFGTGPAPPPSTSSADFVYFAGKDFEEVEEKVGIQQTTLNWILVSGYVFKNDVASIREVFKGDIQNINASELNKKGSGNYSIEIVDAKGNTLFERFLDPFERHFSDHFSDEEPPEDALDYGTFSEKLPFFTKAGKIHFKKLGKVLFTRNVSKSIPTVSVISPNGGEVVKEVFAVNWVASDKDKDNLVYAIFYSPDSGKTWRPLSTYRQHKGISSAIQSFDWDSSLSPGSNLGMIKVVTTDGYNTAENTSNFTFTVTKKAPTVFISHPEESQIFEQGEEIYLIAEVIDPEDRGNVNEKNLFWSSSVDGFLGSGINSVNNLTPGKHVITANYTDKDGQTGSASVAITVVDSKPPEVILHKPQPEIFTTKILHLEVSANEPIVKWVYSLNDKPSVNFVPNTTIIAEEGVNRLVVFAVDRGGNIASDSVEFLVDTEQPLINIISPGEGIPSGRATLIISSNEITVNHKYKLDKSPFIPFINGKTTVNLRKGKHTLTITAEDIAGNIGSKFITFTVV